MKNGKRIIFALIAIFILYLYFHFAIKQKMIEKETDIYKENAKLEVKTLDTLKSNRYNHSTVVLNNKVVFVGGSLSGENIETFDLITKEHKFLDLKNPKFELHNSYVVEISKNSALIFSKKGILEYNINQHEIEMKKDFDFKYAEYLSNILKINNEAFLFSILSTKDSSLNTYHKQEYIYLYKTNKLELVKDVEYKTLSYPDSIPKCYYTQTEDNDIIFSSCKVEGNKKGVKFAPLEYEEIIDIKNKKIKTVNPYDFIPKYKHSTFINKDKTILYHKTSDKFLDLSSEYNFYYKSPLCKYKNQFLINDDEMIVICGIWNNYLKTPQTSIYKYDFNKHEDRWLGWIPIFSHEASYYLLSDKSFIVSGGVNYPFEDSKTINGIYEVNFE